MILGYVVWGEDEIRHIEAAFSILSFLCRSDVDEIRVLTDKPDLYALFRDEPRVNVLNIPSDDFCEWHGKRKFVFRAKIKGIEKLTRLYPGEDILFLDTDTFGGSHVMKVKECLKNGGFCMHEHYGRMNINQGLGKSRQKAWNRIKNRNLNGIQVGDDANHWNAGCVGLPGSRAKEVIENVLRINDAILADWEGTPSNFTEEFAFSMALGAAGKVMDTANFIGHYFKNKSPWQAAIKRFFALSRLRGDTLRQIIEALECFDFKALPIQTHIPLWRRRINAMTMKMLPDKRIRHFAEETATF